MRNILILTDFSDNSHHAVMYTAALTSQVSAFRIVLYHSARPVLPATEITLDPSQYETDAEDDRVYRMLTELKNEVLTLAYSGTVVDIRVDTDPLTEGVRTVIEEEGIDLVVMGILGKDRTELTLFGSNTLSIIRSISISVLVVPPEAVSRPVTTIVFASALKNLQEGNPVTKVRLVARLFNARLLVVNVGKEGADEDAVLVKEQQDFREAWSAEGAEYHYVINDDAAEGIMLVAEAKDAQLVVIKPIERGFFESFFHRSVSKRLAFQTIIPLLIMHGRNG